MPRSSSENVGGTVPGTGSVRAVNDRMAERLLHEPPQPLVEGNYALRVLETRGRVSGRSRRTPVGVLLSGGQEWLVSPVRDRDWVRNLCAEPRCVLSAGGERQHRFAILDEGDRAAIAVTRYLSVVQAPWALQAFPVGPGTLREEVLEQLATMAVFRLGAGDEHSGDRA